jgi:hypothetical protein
MAKGKKGTAGATVKFQAPREAETAVWSMLPAFGQAHGELLGATDLWRLAAFEGIAQFKRCHFCRSGMHCDAHNRSAIMRSAGLSESAAQWAAEHLEIVSLYRSKYEEARGCKPSMGGKDWGMLKSLHKEHGLAVAKEAITNAFADPRRGHEMTLQQIAYDPSRWLGRARKQTGGTLQQERAGA